MSPAQSALAAAIERVEFRPPTVPVLMNVDAEIYPPPSPTPTPTRADQSSQESLALTGAIKANLIAQLTQPVQWERTMRRVLVEPSSESQESGDKSAVPAVRYRDNVCVEVGPGQSCGAIVKKFNRRHRVQCLSTA